MRFAHRRDRLSVEAGLHPGFQIDADARAQSEIAREVVEGHLEEAYSEGSESPLLTLAAEGFGPPQVERALMALVAAGVTEQDFAGRWMLIYFGYTYCPDFCPMSLTNMTQALDLLPPEQAEQLVPMLITIDPERDTVEQLASYAPSFHPRLVALTGTPEQVEQAASAYRVYFAKAESEAATDYLMDHSTFIYLMGPEGNYRAHFGHSTSPEQMAEALATALDG